MAVSKKLSLKCVYADNSNETITVNNLNPTDGVNPNIKAIIKEFNTNKGGTLATKMKSKNGFNWIGIKAATIITTNREYIF